MKSFRLDALSPLLGRLLSLLVVLLMLTAAAAWTGRLFGQPLGGVVRADGDAATPPDSAVLARLGLADAVLSPCDSAAWTVATRDGQGRGILVGSERYAGDISGFAGPTPIYIYIDDDGRVAGLAAAPNGETPHFFGQARDGLFPQWLGKSVSDAARAEVDAVSGATYSSRALVNTVRRTLAARQAAVASGSVAPAIGWGRTLAALAAVAVGLLVAWRWPGRKALRLLVLGLNVAVLGFWCGQFLSVSLLRGWVSDGLSFVLYLPAVALLLVAVVLPYAGKPRYYCTWVCPYGSLQELVWNLPLPKWKVRPAVYKVLHGVRFAVLMALLLLLWSGFGAYLLDYEPFTAFLLTSAPPAVLILAGGFVALGAFVPRLWCNGLCPLGALFELAENKQ